MDRKLHDIPNNNFHFFSNHENLWFIGIIALSLLLRIVPAGHMKLLGDEAMTIALGRFDFVALIRAEVSDCGNPHGYHLFLSFVRQVFGENILLYRIINCLFSSMAVMLAMLLCKAITRTRWIWMGVGLLMALNPMQLIHALEVRPYAIQFCVLLLATLCAVKWTQTRRVLWLPVYVACLFVSFNVQYSTLFYWVGIGVWWIWFCRRKRKDVLIVLAVNTVAVLLLIPSLLYFASQIQAQEITRGESVWAWHLWGIPYVFLLGNAAARPESNIWLLYSTAIPIAILCTPLICLGIRYLLKNTQYGLLVIMLPVAPFLIMLLLSYLHRPFAAVRYAGFAWPMFALIIISGAWTLRDTLRRSVFIVLVFVSSIAFANQAKFLALENNSLAAEYIRKHSGNNIGILCHPYGKNELTLHFPEETLIANIKEVNGSLKMRLTPPPAIDYLRKGSTIEMGISEMMKEYKLPELWFVCGIRDWGTELRKERIKNDMSKVIEILERDYHIQHEYRRSYGNNFEILIMQFIRNGSQNTSE